MQTALYLLTDIHKFTNKIREHYVLCTVTINVDVMIWDLRDCLQIHCTKNEVFHLGFLQ